MIQIVGVLDRVINDPRLNALQEPSQYVGQVAAEYVNRIDQDPCIAIDWYWCRNPELLQQRLKFAGLTLFPHFLLLAGDVQLDQAEMTNRLPVSCVVILLSQMVLEQNQLLFV